MLSTAAGEDQPCGLFASLFLSASACNTTAPNEPIGSNAELVSIGPSTANAGQGFVLQPSQAPLMLSNTTESKDATGVTRRRGSEGAVTLFANGSTLASLNGNAAGKLAFPFTGSADEHNQTVETFFVNAGIPKEQILSFHVNTRFVGGGPVGQQEPAAKFMAFSTILARGIQGILVVDSVAWAELNDNREFVALSVYWPEVPQTVIDDAVTLTNMAQNPTALATYRSRLPSDATAGRVVIRHSSSGSIGSTSFMAKAAYEVTAPLWGRPQPPLRRQRVRVSSAGRIGGIRLHTKEMTT